MRRTTDLSVEDLFKRLGETPMTRRARADGVFRRLRETEEDEVRGSFIRSPKRGNRARSKDSVPPD
jgi:hypothetical protein